MVAGVVAVPGCAGSSAAPGDGDSGDTPADNLDTGRDDDTVDLDLRDSTEPEPGDPAEKTAGRLSAGAPLDFGALPPGADCAGAELPLTNTGTEALWIDAVELDPAGSPAFSIAAVTGAAADGPPPWRLEPGARLSATVRCCPVAGGVARTSVLVFTNAENGPVVRVPAFTVLKGTGIPVVTPGPVTFAPRPVGTTESLTLTVTNPSAPDANRFIDVVGAYVVEAGTPAVPSFEVTAAFIAGPAATIGPGESTEAVLRFTPRRTGPLSAELVLLVAPPAGATDGEAAEVRVPVSGTGGSARLVLDPPQVTIRTSAGGPPVTARVLLRREGDIPLTVTRIRLDDPPGPFALQNGVNAADPLGDPPRPLVLTDANAAAVDVQLTCPDAALHRARATIDTDQGAAPLFIVGDCSSPDCPEGFGDCNGNVADGCETNLRTSDDHCGRCFAPCTRAGAAAACRNGVCTSGDCLAGFGNCNGDDADGCETNLNRSTDHCGRCDNPCRVADGTGACVAGDCRVLSCNTNRGDCNGAPGDGCETNLTNDTAHCGRCFDACTAPVGADPPVCGGGRCSFTCAADRVLSGERCITLEQQACEQALLIDVTSLPLRINGQTSARNDFDPIRSPTCTNLENRLPSCPGRDRVYLMRTRRGSYRLEIWPQDGGDLAAYILGTPCASENCVLGRNTGRSGAFEVLIFSCQLDVCNDYVVIDYLEPDIARSFQLRFSGTITGSP